MIFQTEIRKAQRQCLDWMVSRIPHIGLDQRAEEFVSAFGEFIPRNSQVLDIGGGWGFYVEPLQRLRGCQVTVLDVVEPGLHKAPVITYPGGEMPFPDKSFDVSMLITVLHHVKSPEEVLAEAKRVTRRSVIVVEDLYRHWWGRFWTILRDSFFNLEFVGHPRQFKQKKEWFESFRKLGLKVEAEKDLYTFLLGLPIWNGIFILRCDNE